MTGGAPAPGLLAIAALLLLGGLALLRRRTMTA
jgi:MYXO-CTERM domain-containing protein